MEFLTETGETAKFYIPAGVGSALKMTVGIWNIHLQASCA